jgi:DNA polymerase III alpha subunit
MIVLDAKTDFSFLRGYGTPKQWLERAKEIGVTHFGIADYCSTWGHTPFRKAFKGSGIHLIYGVQLPVTTYLDKDPRHSLVTLLATDDLQPLYELVTKAHQQSYYRPRVLWEQVEAFPGEVIVNHALKHHARHAERFPTAGDAGAYAPCFPSPEHRRGYELFTKIAGERRIGEVDRPAYHMMRDSEALMLGLQNTQITEAIAQHCVADIRPGTLIPSGIENKRDALTKMAYDGAFKLGLIDGSWTMPLEYDDRLKRELDVIEAKHFEDYFFFVEDIVTWAKERMFVGPGRGSAGGSLLCYLLGITTVDPLKFGTLFERFIDITRPDWPDIDIDFPDNRREEVFAYLKDKYGDERVARLGTISEFGGKSALNDCARACGVPYDVSREFGRYTEGVGQGVVISPARIFGHGPEDTLLTPEHYRLLEKYPDMRQAVLIDGHARHHGVHAAGVVVTEGKVTEQGALTKEGVLTMDMKAAEDIGLIKMDALGLRTLSVIQDACDMAGIDPRSLYDLDWNEPEVYALFNDDRVTGIFQFEGQAVRSLMKAIDVERFDDLCALTSLARPGPLVGGAAEHWAKCRNGEEEPRELHPALESTYGVICYQEQMMSIVRDLAGFDEPSVNGMRRAVGKKDPEKLRSYREQFINGIVANAELGFAHGDGIGDYASELWDELCEFGSYAFNLAHAVEYAMISYMTAWLKVHYPLQFVAACLRHSPDDEQGKNLLRELAESGSQFVAFDPAVSGLTWSIIEGKLYGGFDSVRGIGEKTAQKFVAARDADPEHWLEKLTEAQRERILNGVTPWASLTHFGDTYGELYENPEAWRRSYAPAGFRGPVHHIKDIPEKKGNYAFLGRIVKVRKRDTNDESRKAKRGGKEYKTDTFFINLDVEDDTGTVGCTINRFKAEQFKWLLSQDLENRDFFIRGNIIADGRRWVFVDNLVELKGE